MKAEEVHALLEYDRSISTEVYKVLLALADEVEQLYTKCAQIEAEQAEQAAQMAHLTDAANDSFPDEEPDAGLDWRGHGYH